VSLDQLVELVRADTLDHSLPKFGPELALCATILLMLVVRIVDTSRRISAGWIALVGSVVALALAQPWIYLESTAILREELFTGLLVYDRMTVYFRAVLMFFLVVFVVLTWLSGIPDREDGPDFYTLVLGGTLGMCLMASANHLLMVFLAVEMASVPSYALAGLLKGRRQSSEAALKYSIYGAGAAGVMLYGISLLCGVLGTAHLPTMAFRLAEMMPEWAGTGRATVLALGALMVAAGLAFKLSAVPFHFWCPDVFEGASAEVNAFLSVASKAAALALLVRVTMGFASVAGMPAESPPDQMALYSVQDDTAQPGDASAAPGTLSPSVGETAPPRPSGTTTAPPSPESAVTPPAPGRTSAELVERLAPVRRYMVGLVGVLAAITCTLGNLAAYGQTNIKRLLAYSTIAHAGYMIMPVAAAIELVGTGKTETFVFNGQPTSFTSAQVAVASVAFYVGVYLFMNLGAFAVVAFLRNAMNSEEISDYAGLIRRSPSVAILFSMILLSLLGLPPLAGFWGKVLAFGALANAGMWFLLAVGGINTVLSLFYYLRVVKIMTLDPEPEGRLPVDLSLLSPAGLYLAFVAFFVLVFGVWWQSLNEWALAAASGLVG
jgi:NADH-quinone oxidoreductase subunit N